MMASQLILTIFCNFPTRKNSTIGLHWTSVFQCFRHARASDHPDVKKNFVDEIPCLEEGSIAGFHRLHHAYSGADRHLSKE
jgi:hypothetical protein